MRATEILFIYHLILQLLTQWLYQTLTRMEAPQMSMIRRDSKGSLEMWSAMYSMGTIALQEPAHSEGIVATQAQREEGRVVLVHGRRENWEEQVALGGTMDL